MRNLKLNFNGVLAVILAFSALFFFFTIKMTDLADRTAVNEFNKIECTDYAVKYSSIGENGIYKGSENTAVLMLEGTYGFDWAASLEGDYYYANEYTSTDIGLVFSKLVRINLNTFEKEVIVKDAVLRGKCASGELVVLTNYIMDSNSPETNSLCKLYNASFEKTGGENNKVTVMYINPSDCAVVFTKTIDNFFEKTFENQYINRTLEEVRG